MRASLTFWFVSFLILCIFNHHTEGLRRLHMVVSENTVSKQLTVEWNEPIDINWIKASFSTSENTLRVYIDDLMPLKIIPMSTEYLLTMNGRVLYKCFRTSRKAACGDKADSKDGDSSDDSGNDEDALMHVFLESETIRVAQTPLTICVRK